VRQRTVALNTWQANRTALNHLRDHLGEEFTTDRLSTPVLQGFFDRMHALGHAENTLRNVRESVSRFLAWLGQEGKNAALGVVLPRVVHEEVRTWEPEERERLRVAADELDREGGPFRAHRLAVGLALASGGRRNELFALRWEQIRATSRTARITHQVAAERRQLVVLKGKSARTSLLLPTRWDHHRDAGRGFILADARGELVSPFEYVRIRRRILARAGLHRPGWGGTWTATPTHATSSRWGGRFEEL